MSLILRGTRVRPSPRRTEARHHTSRPRTFSCKLLESWYDALIA